MRSHRATIRIWYSLHTPLRSSYSILRPSCRACRRRMSRAASSSRPSTPSGSCGRCRRTSRATRARWARSRSRHRMPGAIRGPRWGRPDPLPGRERARLLRSPERAGCREAEALVRTVGCRTVCRGSETACCGSERPPGCSTWDTGKKRRGRNCFRPLCLAFASRSGQSASPTT